MSPWIGKFKGDGPDFALPTDTFDPQDWLDLRNYVEDLQVLAKKYAEQTAIPKQIY